MLCDEVMSSHTVCLWMSTWVQRVTDDRRCSPCTRPPGWWFLCGHGSTDSSLWSTSGPTGRSSSCLLYDSSSSIYKRCRCLWMRRTLIRSASAERRSPSDKQAPTASDLPVTYHRERLNGAEHLPRQAGVRGKCDFRFQSKSPIIIHVYIFM